MNYGISILFRAIPLLMGAVCLGFGLYVLSGGDDAGHFVAGHVLIALTAICIALFTTAAIIIRQITDTFAGAWKIILPIVGYSVATATVAWGLWLRSDTSSASFVAGHVVFGVGLVAACVSTVGAASSAFTLIPRNAAGSHGDGVPAEAYGRPMAWALLGVPVAATLIAGVWAVVLLVGGARADHFVAGHVLLGLTAICSSLIALVGTVVRQVRNQFDEPERWSWSVWVLIMGAATAAWGLFVLFSSDRPERVAPGCILLGLGMICFSIISKVWLLASVWRREFPLADRVPIIPVMTCLACLFFAAFLAEAATTDPNFFVPARVLTGLGAVCFTLFSIVSILEAGTSKKK
ncbi:DUF2776 domain-containing protein [Microbacterium sp. zg.B48]|uniref:DUF2776 domain-containing protein n=1 Tax=unclassified Microbacterium TaxID=2609290 RepID=UPI00214CCAF6|nr:MULTISPECIES: DUF2776 domain-containing protein [unclassified Microbacterium]MCR2764793.1 DUF2776 domain-containing protein [Microbacterium sp. zg.B48]MCR2810069.1 DUF2776 domain-containing protein [Microbacterium sp. zg.B185]WIM20093.1 DUF2776 domain-containing protein [Microbacterium sp. zg-B185]